MHQPGEPSVEVILDSIKRVIAREGRPAGGGPRTLTEYERPEVSYDTGGMEPTNADEGAEVLQLDEDEIVNHPPLRLADEPAGAIPLEESSGQGDDNLIAYGWDEPEGLGQAAKPPRHEPSDDDHVSPHTAPVAQDPPLTSSGTRNAMRENLAALSTLSALSRERQARGEQELSIDALARDLLRPMLAEWLDTNLPPIVERLVQTEIKRIIGEQG
jgi:cell pole-organizing protein PopZ